MTRVFRLSEDGYAAWKAREAKRAAAEWNGNAEPTGATQSGAVRAGERPAPTTSGGVESRNASAQEDRPRVGMALPVIADARSTSGQPCAHRAGVAPGPLTRNAGAAGADRPRSSKPVQSGSTPDVRSIYPLVLPWPTTTGNHAVRHGKNGPYLLPNVIEYRNIVAVRCARHAPIAGRYRLHLTLSPPDKRRRDADNAIKVLADALVRCGYLPDDSLAYMRELHVTVDGYRGEIVVRVEAA